MTGLLAVVLSSVFLHVGAVSGATFCVEQECSRDVGTLRTHFGDHNLLQQRVHKQQTELATATCTGPNNDPYATGDLLECCAGYNKQVGEWSEDRPDSHYLCKPEKTSTTIDDGNGDKEAGKTEDSTGESPGSTSQQIETTVKPSCTSVGRDPYSSGSLVECCAGSGKKVGQWSENRSDWYWLCKSDPNTTPAPADGQGSLSSTNSPNPTGAPSRITAEATPSPGSSSSASNPTSTVAPSRTTAEVATSTETGCTDLDNDPYASGAFIPCCADMQRQVGKWSEERSDYYWLCKAATGVSTAAPEPVEEGSSTYGKPQTTVPPRNGQIFETRILNWNVHYTNKDMAGIASIVAPNNPDIVGICELTAPVGDLASALSSSTGRNFEVQPGRNSWVGYGTDIFYDAAKWEALEGGARKADCSGSRGGSRSVNWVALKERASGQFLVTGGIHLSYCAEGCEDVHACELTMLYDKLEEMKAKYNNAPVIWMGDTNRAMHTTVMKKLLDGSTGHRSTFRVEDLGKTRENTYFSGGPAIDHILGERGAFAAISGGRTGQGTTGQHLEGADHFPVYVHARLN